MIKCQICNWLFKQITNTHLKFHGITIEEYRKKYNPKHLQCKAMRAFISEQLTDRKLSKEHKEKISKKLEGYKQTEEHKENISKGLEGNTNGLGYKFTKEQKENARIRMSKRWKDKICTEEKNCRGYVKYYKIRNHKGDIEKVHGSFERRVGRALTKLGIRWKKTKKWFKYKLNGEVKEYNPDFWLKDDRYYLEMKNYIDVENHEIIVAKQKMMDKRGKRKGFICEMMFDIDIRKLEREVRRNEVKK